MDTLVFATNNAHKLDEVRKITEGLVRIVSLADINCHDDIPETADTLEGNALQKARYIKEHYGYDCFADDTGLEVEALNNAPGVYSARFAGEPCDDDANNRLLVEKLREKDDRRAHYTCVLVAVRTPDDPEPLVAVGRWYGEIQDEPAGTGGFGYDPYFRLPEFGKTAAELTAEEKNGLSHRGKALRRMIEMIRESWGW